MRSLYMDNVKSIAISCKENSKETDFIMNKILNHKLLNERFEVKKDLENPDLVICLGGDGTFLEAYRRYKDKNPVFIGINSGSLGFLQDVPIDDIDNFLELLSTKERIDIKYLPTIKIKVSCRDDEFEFFAINEIYVTGKNLSSIEFSEYISQEFLQKVRASGIIISTPVGTTGMSDSFGGPIVVDGEILVSTLIGPIRNKLNLSFFDTSIVSKNLKVVIDKNFGNKVDLVIDGKRIEIEKITNNEVTQVACFYHKNSLKILDLYYFSRVENIRKKKLGIK